MPTFLRRRSATVRNTWAQAGVWPSSVVMSYPLAKDSAQVMLIEGNHRVQAFSSNRSHQPLAEGIGLRCPDRGSDRSNPEVLDRSVELRRKGLTSIVK